MIVPPLLCVTGSSGSGKTALLERLIAGLTGLGMRVGAIKHCRHVDIGDEGKDSDRLAAAGADPAVAAAPGGMVSTGGSTEPDLLDLAATHCAGRDLVLVEGYKHSPFDKILVAEGKPSGGCLLSVPDPFSADASETETAVLAWLERRRAFREDLAAAVMTGGASRRMGFDKTSLRINGRRLLGRLGELLADRAGRVTFVGAEPDWTDMPACFVGRWHVDLPAGCGPMGGVVTALRHAASGRSPCGVCVLACDMPALGGPLLDHLLSARDRAAPATALVSPDSDRWEPLAAIYEPRALPALEKAIDADRLSLTEWLSEAGARSVRIPPPLTDQAAGANTPEELQMILDRLDQSSP